MFTTRREIFAFLHALSIDTNEKSLTITTANVVTVNKEKNEIKNKNICYELQSPRFHEKIDFGLVANNCFLEQND